MTQRPPSQIELAVRKWAFWAPMAEAADAARAGDRDGCIRVGEAEPDARFIPPMLRRRLGRVGRMAFRAAADCLGEDLGAGGAGGAGGPPACVFCSRYGDFGRAFAMLQGLAAETPPSPNAFSHSVHNNPPGMMSMFTGDRGPATALAALDATLEAGFLEAWSRLQSADAGDVLVVLADEPLPDAYADVATDIAEPAALALLLAPAAPGRRGLRLAWRAADAPPEPAADRAHPARRLMRLLSGDGPSVDAATERLVWTWTAIDAAH